jgi:hypothetical protein
MVGHDDRRRRPPAFRRTVDDSATAGAHDATRLPTMARSLTMHPLRDLTRAVTMPLTAVFVVGLCAVINAMTYSGTWWVKWVALGMGIATVVALGRGLRTIAVLALVAIVGAWIYRRYGAAARRTFDEWAGRARPTVAEVLGRVGRDTAAPMH